MLTVRVLGGASIEGDAGPLTGPATQRHRLALLALLATSHPGGLGRDKLLAYLWPKRDTESARNLLNQSVYVLRKTLGEKAIRSSGDELRLDPEAVRVDVLEFEEALAAGDLELAVELYRGPFLDGFFLPDALEFEHRVDAERARFRDAYRKALEGLAEAAAERGDATEAVEWWRCLAAEDPYNSRVTIELMKALESTGARAEAIRHARVQALLLEQEFGAEPDPVVTALAERIRRDPAYEPGAEPAASVEPALPVDPVSRDGPAQVSGEEPAGGVSPVGPPAPRRRFRKRTVGLLVGAVLLAIAGWAMVSTLSGDAPEVDRIAVLPLANLTGDPGQDYFVAGMHDALVMELGRIADLTVISRQSVLRYQGSDEPLPAIARELGVDALVEGAVFLAGDSVRITAQLVQAEPEEHLWTDSYHGSLREALALQGEVAGAIARAVRASVTPEEQARLASAHAVKPEAQEAYLRGLHHLEQHALGTAPADRSIRTAIAYLEEAVALDPEWAAAHARLALAYHWLASGPFGDHHEFFPKSKAAALRAMELDETEAQAHASLGFVLLSYEWDWAGAERAIRRSLELESREWTHWIYGLYLLAVGRYDEAITQLRQAEERNPLSAVLKGQVGDAYFCAGRYDEAIAYIEHTLQLWPDGALRPQRMHTLGYAHSAKSMHAEAIEHFEKLVAVSDSAAPAVAGLAYVYARAGRHEQVHALLPWLQEQTGWEGPSLFVPTPYVYTILGESERAVAMVEAAFGKRDVGKLLAAVYLPCFPEWELLAGDPRIQQILDEIGLPG